MKSRQLQRASVASVAVLALAAPVIPAIAHSGSGPAVYGPKARIEGRPLAYWAAEIAVWEQELPANKSPLTNPGSGLNCTTDEFPMAYIGWPTTINGRVCAVPAGQPIYLPTFSWECSTAEAQAGLLGSFRGRTWRNLRRCVTEVFKLDFGRGEITLKVWVDGKLIKNPHRYVLTTRPRVADLPENNVWEAFYEGTDVEVQAGPTKTLTRGFFIVLKGLERGRHRIRMFADIPVFGPKPIRDVWRVRVTAPE
jgi:hypothetical protein